MFLKNLRNEQKRQNVGILELICREFELTESQFRDAESKYQTVGKYLDEGGEIKAFAPIIFSQGSMRLGTTVRPIGRDEFDIDLVCKLTRADLSYGQAYIRDLIKDRLEQNEIYKKMLEPLNRGWRLNYAKSSKFHLDITPAVLNNASFNNGLLVPDKKLKCWKPSNPQGYADWFEAYAALQSQSIADVLEDFKAKVEPLPQQIPFKGILKRCVQILKRHRDVFFQNIKQPELAPISIIITTLAAKTYGDLVNNSYDNELDLLFDLLTNLHQHIHVSRVNNKRVYNIPNETTKGENFAEKWNENPSLAEAFYRWQKVAIRQFDEIGDKAGRGLDTMKTHLSESLGEKETAIAFNRYTEAFNRHRSDGNLEVLTGVGLTTRTGQGVRNKEHTYFGK